MEDAGPERADESRDERFRGLGEEASRVAQRAASVLEEEVAAGIPEAQRVERRLTEERRVDEGEFSELTQRFRKNVHELITLASDRVAELRTDEMQDLVQRFTSDAHTVFDTMMNLVNLAPEAINRLAERTEPRNDGIDRGPE
jgi:hypothetical protein